MEIQIEEDNEVILDEKEKFIEEINTAYKKPEEDDIEKKLSKIRTGSI